MSTEMGRVAIMGAGSIGTVLGALMTQSGLQVDLVDAYKPHVMALREKGATITGGLELNVPVVAYTPDELSGIYDVVFLLCKQTGTRQALAQMLPHLHPKSVVCALQNGIPEELVSSIVGKERTIGGIVLFGATWMAPGVVCCTSSGEYMRDGMLTEIGELDGSLTQRLYAVQKLLGQAGRCDLTQRLLGLRWTKILINATASGMSAAMGCTYGDILDRKDAMLALAHIGDETAKVAHAKGIQLITVDGNDYEEREILEGQNAEDKLDFYYQFWGEKHRALKASMLQDLEKGRPCEIDFINGQVCQGGKEEGILTPYNDMVVALVQLAQSRKQVWTPEEVLPFFQILLKQEYSI